MIKCQIVTFTPKTTHPSRVSILQQCESYGADETWFTEAKAERIENGSGETLKPLLSVFLSLCSQSNVPYSLECRLNLEGIFSSIIPAAYMS